MIKGDSTKGNENRLNDAALDEISGGGAIPRPQIMIKPTAPKKPEDSGAADGSSTGTVLTKF